ncbi:MAG TPA: hypothetical protein VFB04_08840 [Terriglobales bacterium]|nr:hypothetical protein [Terriglobales bacterium]
MIRFPGLLNTLLLLTFMAPLRAEQPSATVSHDVDVQMRNVIYHYTDQVAVQIRALRGQFVPLKGDVPVFDDKNSFALKIASAEIAITPESLSNVLNSYVLAKADAPLKAVSVQIVRDQLTIKGKLHNKGDIPFETEGILSITQDGKIRLHTEKVKALHLPVKGIMDLLGLKISDLINTGKIEGVAVDQDDLILDPAKLLPPPHITGRITKARLERDNIILVFGHTSAAADMNVPFANYMAFRHNQLRFGKLTMTDTDMVLIDMDPHDPFDFYLDHYKEQLVAGYTKETPAFGLRVFMHDYNKLSRGKLVPSR